MFTNARPKRGCGKIGVDSGGIGSEVSTNQKANCEIG
jgi:hypothetical protein